MYESHFHLNNRPFASAPHPDHYFPAASIEQAREAIALNVERAAGVTLLMGPVGSGKTLLCQLIANHFSSELPICMLPGERAQDRTLLLQATLHHLGLPFHDLDDGELRLTLTNHVMGPSCPKGLLMIVDEADRLPLELLEELRVITNLVQDGQSRVRLLLAGALRLEERVGHPKLESLNQRVVGRLHLEYFSKEETADYVRARITSCGGDVQSIFTDGALYTIYRATAGVPRLINQVCNHVLLMSNVGEADQMDEHVIEEAWADLQQLPIPHLSLEAPAKSTKPDVVVEIGSLDDDDTIVSASAQLDELQQVVSSLNEETENKTVEIANNVQLEDNVEVSSDFELETKFVIAGSPDIESDRFERNIVKMTVDDPQDVEASIDSGVACDDDFELKTTTEELAAIVSTFVEHDEFVTHKSNHQNVHESIEQVFDKADTEQGQAEEVQDETTEMTIEEATNPFDEEFLEEEIVIQQFGSPSRLARQGQECVTSAYSHRLANQLSAAHPGLSMHSEDIVPDVEIAGNEFQPLSTYIDDECDYGESDYEEGESEVTIEFESERFDPSSDPVLPEPVLMGTSEDTRVDTSVAIIGGQVVVERNPPAVPDQVDGPEVQIAVEAEAAETVNPASPDATIVIESKIELRPPRAKKKKMFRKLFSSLRRR